MDAKPQFYEGLDWKNATFQELISSFADNLRLGLKT